MLRTIMMISVAAGLLGAASLGALPGTDGPDKRDLARHAKISMQEAIAKAREARPGAVVEVELEGEHDGGKLVVFFEVIVVTPNHELHEVAVHAASGKILEIEKCDDPDERAELAQFRRVLRHAELTLPALVAKAAEVIKGQPVEAYFEMEDGHPACEILFVNDRYLIDVDLEARAGHLMELELAGVGDEDEDEDEGEEGDEGDEEDEGDEDEDEDEDGDDTEHEGREQASGTWSVRRPTPLADSVKFSAKITHPYFPLSTVRHTVLMEDEDEKVIREVLDKTRTVAGVTCLVLAEKEYEDGELAEISYNLFAQDPEGNVYYFGEDVDDYKQGKVVGHGGAWMVGKNAKEPCLFMPAKLQKGLRFKREDSPPAAEEFDEIVRWDVSLKVPAGQFTDVLVIREGDVKGRWSEKKYYARGVGLISENRELNLVELRRR